MLATAPADVRLLFDDQIRPAGGDLAVDAHGRSVLGGKPRRQGSRVLVVPLRAGLAKGSYTVRWRVISNDGHLISGVVAFGIGTKPVATLTAGGDGPSAWAVLLRLLLLGGLLAAGGAALTGRLLEAGRLETLVVGVGLGLAAAGGFGLLAIEPGAASTRFGHFTEATAIVAAAGAGAAVLSLALPALGLAAWAAAALALAGPTLAGHALDPRHYRALIALADYAHVAAAAVWIGGLVLLALGNSPAARRRFPWIAAGAVGVLGVASIGRAIAAFPSLSSLVDTGYGRAVLVKTGIVAAVLALGWSNRRRLARVGFYAELVLLAGIVVAVAVLTDLRPPVRAAAAAARARAAAASAARRARTRGRGRRRRDRPRRVAARVADRGAGDRARPRGEGRRRARRHSRRSGHDVLRARVLLGHDPVTATAQARAGTRRRPDAPVHAPEAVAGAAGGLDRAPCRPRLPLAAHARHPRAPRRLGAKRDHDDLSRAGAEPSHLQDRRRPRGGGDRRRALGQASAREVGAVADGAAEGARAFLGLGSRCAMPACSRRATRRSTTRGSRHGSSSRSTRKSGRLLRLQMTATAHFMQHRYTRLQHAVPDRPASRKRTLNTGATEAKSGLVIRNAWIGGRALQAVPQRFARQPGSAEAPRSESQPRSATSSRRPPSASFRRRLPAAAATAPARSALSINDIYRRAAPGVVQVTSTSVVTVPADPFFGNPFFPQQQQQKSLGSGFVIDKAGHIVTNYHVVQGAKQIERQLLERRDA